MNDCPAGKLAAIEAKAAAAEYHADRLFKNGPRAWVIDRLTVITKGEMFAKTLDFSGLKARFAGVVQLPPDRLQRKPGAGGDTPTTIARDTEYVIFKGHPIFILDDPQGRPWMMQAYSKIVDPSLTLDRDLVIHPGNGTARIVQDNLENTYDLCFATACSWTP